MAQRRAYKVYTTAVTVTGIAALIILAVMYPVHNLFGAAFFALLAIAAETQSVFIGNRRTISVASAIVTSAMLISGPTAAVLIAVVSPLGTITRVNGKARHIFNIKIGVTALQLSCRALSYAVMSAVYLRFGGTLIGKNALFHFSGYVPALAAGIFFGALTSFTLSAVTVSLKGRRGLFRVMPKRLLATGESALISLLGVFLTVLYVSYGWFMVTLFFLPLLLARYSFITYQELQENYLQTVDSLASAIEAKDEYTSGHSKRVEQYSGLIAHEMKFSEKRCENLKYAAILHDIGKIGIPERILNKPDKLNKDEWESIKSHSVKGAHIIEEISFLRDAVEIVRAHHEWYNGGGYPDGKSAKNMPVEAMVICVADAFDAMTSDRPYRQRLPADSAMKELRSMAGIQFSPEIVEAFERAMIKSGKFAKVAQ